MSRFGKRLEVERARQEVPLTPFFFDLLYLDGGSLMDEPARQRLAALHELAPAPTVVPRLVTASSVEADRFLRTAIERGHEGIMAKALDATYQAGTGPPLAQDQAGEYARPRRPGGRVGSRTPARLAQQSPPRRPGSGPAGS